MPTKRRLGTVVTPSKATFDVSLEQWANEAPDTLELNGYACLVFFDPGSATGRAQVRDLIRLLTQALDEVDAANVTMYRTLKPGDYCNTIRLPGVDDGETQCQLLVPRDGDQALQCSRVGHDDPHHVVIDADYRVLAVSHG
jgi:hypothetical protein